MNGKSLLGINNSVPSLSPHFWTCDTNYSTVNTHSTLPHAVTQHPQAAGTMLSDTEQSGMFLPLGTQELSWTVIYAMEVPYEQPMMERKEEFNFLGELEQTLQRS